MSFSPALRWSVLLLLLMLLSLGWKLAVQRGGWDELKEKDSYRKVAEFLVRQRFSVSISEKLQEGEPTIRAASGACRILIARSGSEGADRDRIRHHATATDTVFVVFGGRVFREQPTWQTTLNSLWAKFWRELGFDIRATPVLVIIATNSCDAERLPWAELG